MRLQKFTPQAPFSDIFVLESDSQNDEEMPVANDELHAQSWNTNFGSNPFDEGPSEYPQIIEDTEYIAFQIPKDNRPPSPASSKTSGSAQWNRPLNQMKITKMKLNSKSVKLIKTPKKFKKIQIILQKMMFKNPRKFSKYPIVRRTHNNRVEKYYLRPNPNPNYSDSYRY